jgi:transposase
VENIDYKALYEASLREKAALEKLHALDKSMLYQENATLSKENATLNKEKTTLNKENATLNKENATLNKEYTTLNKQKISLEEERALLLADLDNLRRQIFGIRSDKLVKLTIAGQLDMFSLNAPAPLIEQVGEELQEAIKKLQEKSQNSPKKPKRVLLPAHLERKELLIDPKGDLSDYKVIGSDSCEILVIEPMKMWVKRIVRRKWALKNSMDIHKPGVIMAPAPSRTVKGGLFDESVLAFLLVSKYYYHLPLHRIKQMFTHHNVPISSSTLSDNVAASIRALEPFYKTERKTHRSLAFGM